MKKLQYTRQGFTLIELLVVVLIIGILASVAWPQYQKAVWKSHAVEAQLNINKILQAFSLYQLETGQAPQQSGQIHGIANKEIMKSLDLWFTDQVYKDIIVTYYNGQLYSVYYLLRYPDYNSPYTCLHWQTDGPQAKQIKCLSASEKGNSFCQSLCGPLQSINLGTWTHYCTLQKQA